MWCWRVYLNSIFMRLIFSWILLIVFLIFKNLCINFFLWQGVIKRRYEYTFSFDIILLYTFICNVFVSSFFFYSNLLSSIQIFFLPFKSSSPFFLSFILLSIHYCRGLQIRTVEEQLKQRVIGKSYCISRKRKSYKGSTSRDRLEVRLSNVSKGTRSCLPRAS